MNSQKTRFSPIRRGFIVIAGLMLAVTAAVTLGAFHSMSLAQHSPGPPPALRGQQAFDSHKQERLYDSLNQAMQAARYSVNWARNGLLSRSSANRTARAPFTLGNYPNASVQAGSNTTITPDAAPTNATSVTATAIGFQGTLTVDPATGVVRVANAGPAGSYSVTVNGFGAGGTATASFTLTVNNGAACITAGFTGANVNVGLQPRSVAVGDFNGDGKLDFATANYGLNISTVSIRLGDSAGNFSGSTEVSVGTNPRSVAVGDFNGDGKLDIATANSVDATVSIRLGNGAGNFSGSTEVSVGFGPQSVAMGDFNNDGKLDFVTANQASNNVSIRLGDGAGGFTSPATAEVVLGGFVFPISVATGDFNGDGKLDFATANQGTNNVSIRLGDGAGGFTSPAPPEVSVGSSPYSVAAGDFNGDGKLDFVAANKNSNTVSIRLGDGAGGFTSPATPEVSVGSNPFSVAIGDFNGDGKRDFVAANYNASTVSIRMGNGAGGFTTPATPEMSVGSQPYSIAVGDFNSDSKLDFITANELSAGVTIGLNNCLSNTPPTISAQVGITMPGGVIFPSQQIATVNDLESGANGVTITVNGGSSATVNGITVWNIVNSSGTVIADISVATCTSGSVNFTLAATDGNGATTTATLGVGVTGITLSALVNGLTFVPYLQTLTASGGATGVYNFSLVSGTLPAGLTLNGNVLSGTPTTAGASNFTIRATDGSSCFGERTYTLNIGSTGLMYYPLAHPIRLLDTRPGASPNACSQPNAQITQGTPFNQIARGTCDGLTIPANATTLTGNVTVVQPAANGFLTLYPSDAPQPGVANSNFLAGEVLNNAFTVGLSVNNGAFNIFVNSTSHVVIDVTGYYAPPASGGLYFHPLPKPIRLLDTRSGNGITACQTPGVALQEMSTRTQTGVLTCDGVTIPLDAQALVGNATTTNSASSGYLTLYPANATQPFASSSNFAAGVNRNAPFTVGLSPSGEFNIYTARTTDLVIDVMGYYSAQANDTNGQGLLFNSLGAPLRLLDTRAVGATGCYTPGAKMMAMTPYTQETQISCTNLTSSARALVGNVSALNAEGNGFVTFWPSNAAQPTVATSNYQTGRVFNRHFTVGLGPDIAFKRYVLSTTDLIIDIAGFFAP